MVFVVFFFLVFSAFENSLYLLGCAVFFFFFLTSFKQRYSKKTLTLFP